MTGGTDRLIQSLPSRTPLGFSRLCAEGGLRAGPGGGGAYGPPEFSLPRRLTGGGGGNRGIQKMYPRYSPTTPLWGSMRTPSRVGSRRMRASMRSKNRILLRPSVGRVRRRLTFRWASSFQGAVASAPHSRAGKLNLRPAREAGTSPPSWWTLSAHQTRSQHSGPVSVEIIIITGTPVLALNEAVSPRPRKPGVGLII